MKLPPSMATDVHIIGTGSYLQIISNNKTIIGALTKTNKVEIHENEPSLGFASTGVVEGLKIMIPLPEEMVAQERSRWKKKKTD